MYPGAYGSYGFGNTQGEAFGSRTFYGGSLTGYRSWRVTDDGVLHPVVQSIPYDWTLGVNEAHCYRTQVTGSYQPVLVDVPIYDDKGNVVDTVKRHEMVSKQCTCGFWAYFPGGGSHHSSGYISGLVKGTGKVVRGPKGFRCEKAQILAFIEPKAPTRVDGDLLRKVLGNYVGIPLFENLREATRVFPISSFPSTTAITTGK